MQAPSGWCLHVIEKVVRTKRGASASVPAECTCTPPYGAAVNPCGSSKISDCARKSAITGHVQHKSAYRKESQKSRSGSYLFFYGGKNCDVVQ